LVIRRELARSGRHRAFVNDSPVTVGLLERLGDHLVDVHGQHEQQRLLESGAQLDLLDRFAGAEATRARVAELHGHFQAAAAALEAAAAQIEEALLAIRELREGVVVEPGRLEAIDDRLDALTRLKRKYGESEEAMLAFRDRAATELDRLARHDELLAADEER